jgi:hypothetical protein
MRVIGVTTTHTAAELAHAHMVIGDFRGMTLERLRSLFAGPSSP